MKKKEKAQKGDPPRARGASGRQRKYVTGVLAGKTKKKAATDAGYSKHTATKPKQIEAKPAVRQLFTELLEAQGITDGLLAKRIYQGLFAMETKTASSEGRITDKVHLVAFAERREMLELALKLKGHLIDKHELRMVRTLEQILEDSHE